MIDAADEERLRAFGAETVVRLTRDNELLASVSRLELGRVAWQALDDACRHVLTAGPAKLRRHLAQVAAGVLTDGDMDGLLLTDLPAARDVLIGRPPAAAQGTGTSFATRLAR